MLQGTDTATWAWAQDLQLGNEEEKLLLFDQLPQLPSTPAYHSADSQWLQKTIYGLIVATYSYE
jgi:hypothetical protein